jgi:hypothetical protein
MTDDASCIGCLEEYVAVGTTSGEVKLYDSSETELKVLSDKSVRGSPVTCLDIKRVDKSQNIFVVCGNQKGQIALYEVKGLVQQHIELMSQSEGKKEVNSNANCEFKHRKTVDDAHKDQIV